MCPNSQKCCPDAVNNLHKKLTKPNVYRDKREEEMMDKKLSEA